MICIELNYFPENIIIIIILLYEKTNKSLSYSEYIFIMITACTTYDIVKYS